MAVVMGADGQLINTSNIGGVGASLIPNLAPNIGALANVGGSVIPSGVANDDGTITLPTIEMKTRDPGLALGEMQKIYGTKYMPMFQFIEAQQTGTYTYDPTDDNMMSPEELDTIRQEFESEHGMSADQALQMAQMERMGQKLGGATGAAAGSAFGAAMAGGATPETAFGAGFDAVNPLSFLNKNKAPAEAVAAGKGMMATGSANPAIGDALVQSTNYSDRLLGRLDPTTDAGMANLKITGYAAGADFITQVAMGADPMDAAKDAGKTAVLGYVADAIIPGSGNIVRFLSKFI
jgi:tetrahydromethanopterin S-methyltransferase subunit F